MSLKKAFVVPSEALSRPLRMSRRDITDITSTLLELHGVTRLYLQALPRHAISACKLGERDFPCQFCNFCCDFFFPPAGYERMRAALANTENVTFPPILHPVDKHPFNTLVLK